MPCRTESQFVELFTKYSKMGLEAGSKEAPVDFVEGLVYSENESVLMVGDMTNDLPAGAKLHELGHWSGEWFSWYAERQGKEDPSKPAGPVTEYLPLRHFYHRHTRSIFWELQDMIPAAIGNNVLFRKVFGWLIPPKVSFLKLVQPESMRLWYEKRHVIQVREGCYI
jgi:delta24-sterol reductase